MFFAIILIVIGVVILLNTMGWLTGNIWGFFWAAVFVIVGLKMLKKKHGCPMCGMHGKMMGGHDCCGGHDHNHEEHNHQ